MAVQYDPRVNFDVVPQIRQALSIIETVFSRFGYIPLVTSARDRTHKVGSLHYLGAAMDIASQGLPLNVRQSIYNQLKSTFPLPTWWFDWEDQGTANEHYHLEYKPAKYSELDPYSVEPSDMLTYLPGESDNILFPQPEMAIQQGYPQYPSGTVPPQYFTPYEQPIGWLAIVGIIIAGWIFLELTE